MKSGLLSYPFSLTRVRVRVRVVCAAGTDPVALA
jgi:hypothetical protein